jgi:hypothetical protein
MTKQKYSLPLMVALLALLEGLVIYLNLVVHPDSQPGLTIVIVILFAIVSGTGVWYRTRVLGTIIS